LQDEAKEALNQYHWPGNIRELRNVIERAVLFARSTHIGVDDLNFDQRRAKPQRTGPTTLNLEQLERLAVEEALRQCDWVQNQAAVLLGITPRALSYKIKRMGIDHPGLRERQRKRA
jgi:DNA-binding NtrC family response regulator